MAAVHRNHRLRIGREPLDGRRRRAVVCKLVRVDSAAAGPVAIARGTVACAQGNSRGNLPCALGNQAYRELRREMKPDSWASSPDRAPNAPILTEPFPGVSFIRASGLSITIEPVKVSLLFPDLIRTVPPAFAADTAPKRRFIGETDDPPPAWPPKSTYTTFGSKSISPWSITNSWAN